MNYILVIILVAVLAKWIFLSSSFVVTAIYTNRRKKKAIIEARKLHPVTSAPALRATRFELRDFIRGGVYRFVNGCNKVSNEYVGRIPNHHIRMFIYKYVLGVSVANKVVIYKGTIFRSAYRCQIGEGSIIGDDNMIDAREGVSIGKNCNLSTGVKIWTGQHDVQSSDFAYTGAPVMIDDYVWISGNVTILPGVHIEKGAVIASGAVVTKDCNEYGIYAGVPARKIGDRNHDLTYHFDGRHDWFL